MFFQTLPQCEYVFIPNSSLILCVMEFTFCINTMFNSKLYMTHQINFNTNTFNVTYILYINSVSLSVSPSIEVLKPKSLLIKLSPWTRGPKNYSGTSSFYFLLLLLRPFSRSNCRRQWGRYFWDLEGGWGDLGALFLG